MTMSGADHTYIAIAKSAESDSVKTSCLTALLLQEENQSLLECFRGEGQCHGHGTEAQFEGAPNWRVVIAKLESFSQHLLECDPTTSFGEAYGKQLELETVRVETEHSFPPPPAILPTPAKTRLVCAQ